VLSYPSNLLHDMQALVFKATLCDSCEDRVYRGTWLISNGADLGPFIRAMPRDEGGLFLMSEVHFFMEDEPTPDPLRAPRHSRQWPVAGTCYTGSPLANTGAQPRKSDAFLSGVMPRGSLAKTGAYKNTSLKRTPPPPRTKQWAYLPLKM
jgi:hypothetical protein